LQYQHCAPDHCVPLLVSLEVAEVPITGFLLFLVVVGGLPMVGPDGIDGVYLKVRCGGFFLHSSYNYRFSSFIVLLDDFLVFMTSFCICLWRLAMKSWVW
jgi:hypothetical protein